MKLDRGKLMRAREMLGYGVEKAAQEAGVSKNSVLRAEHEEDIRPITARKIAAALKVEVRNLLPLAPGVAPLEVPHPLETPDEVFEEMVRDAGVEQLGAMKRKLTEHLPGGGPLPLPQPTDKQLLAVRRCIAIHQEQERRHKAKQERLEAEQERLEAERESLRELEAAVSA